MKSKTTFLDNIDEFFYSGSGPTSNIYFVVSQVSRTKDYLNRVKIGYSKDPVNRIQGLQVGNAHKLNLWYSFAVDEKDAKYLEDQLHKKFRWSKDRGEWFQIHPCVRKFIKEHKRLSQERAANPIKDPITKRDYVRIPKGMSRVF